MIELSSKMVASPTYNTLSMVLMLVSAACLVFATVSIIEEKFKFMKFFM